MIPYARQWIDDSDVRAIERVLRSQFLTQGSAVPQFERLVAQYVGAEEAVAVSSATAALHLTCLALGIGPDDRVWTSPISFVASANCARYCGAAVDFVDVDPRTYVMDVAQLEEKLERAALDGALPKAIVAVDFGGQPCDLARMATLRERFGFALIEDASHTIGATYRERRVGSGFADVAVFSFHPVKMLTTGEGGMIVTDNAELARGVRLLRSHGITRDPKAMTLREPWEYEQQTLGFNYRMTDIQAALGSSQFERIDAFLARRRAIAARYDDAFATLPLQLPTRMPDRSSAWHLYPVQVLPFARRSRREVYDALLARGVKANVHYIPIHLQPYYQKLGFAAGDFPVAEAYYRRALSLPMFAALTDDEQEHVIASVREALRSADTGVAQPVAVVSGANRHRIAGNQ